MFDSFRRLLATTLTFACLAATTPAGAASLSPEASEDFIGNRFEWMTGPSALSAFGKPENETALREVAHLIHEGDERAGLALQNYMNRYPRDPLAFDLAGAALMQSADYPEAAVAFRKGLLLSPENEWLRAKYGAALVLAGDPIAGRLELERTLERSADNPLALRYLALLAVQRGDIAQAIVYSERALRVFGLPRGVVNQAHFDLAELYARTLRPRDIVELLRPAVRNPDLDLPPDAEIELYGRYMDAAIQVGDAEAARSAFEAMRPLIDTSQPQVALAEARITRLQGDAEGALAGVRAIIDENPAMAPALRPDLATFLTAAGRIDEAVGIWREIAAEHPAGEDVPYLREALQTQIDAGDGDAALAEASELATDHPERADLALLQLEVLGKTAQPARALELATEAVERFPNDADLHRMRGVLAAAQGDTAIATASLRRALEIDPQQPQTWLMLAGVVHGHGQYVGGHAAGEGHANVEALLEEAVAANPSAADLHAEMGLMYLSDGRVNDAIVAFDRAVQSNPAHMAGLSLGALARADVETDLGAALAMADRAHAMAPDEAINQDILGWVLVRQGAYDNGLGYLTRALEAEPEDVVIHYHLGVAYADTGETAKARTHLLQAMSGPNYEHNEEDARRVYLQHFSADAVTAEVATLVGEAPLGTVEFRQTEEGVEVTANLEGLSPGQYGTHIHEFATCDPGEDGTPGGAAGSHYGHGAAHDHGGSGMDHAAMGHATAHGATGDVAMDHVAMGHTGAGDGTMKEMEEPTATSAALPAGDMAGFSAGQSGTSTTSFVHRQFTLDEIRGRSLMIHDGADANGMSGPKVACAVIP